MKTQEIKNCEQLTDYLSGYLMKLYGKRDDFTVVNATKEGPFLHSWLRMRNVDKRFILNLPVEWAVTVFPKTDDPYSVEVLVTVLTEHSDELMNSIIQKLKVNA